MAEQTATKKTLAGYRPLSSVLLVFTCLSLFYTALVPPFEGPDGPEHFAYVTWLAEGKGFPPQGEAAWETPVKQEAGQPPLYYFLASIPARFIDLNGPTAEFRPNPHFPSGAPGHVPDNKNIAIHYPADNVLQGGWLALRLARFVSFLFGVLLIVSVYKLAQEFFPESTAIPVVSALITATIPQVLFISNVVSNDMAAAATGALTLWMLARLIKRGPDWKTGLALGLAFGLAALSKTGNLALGLPVAAVFLWLLWQKKVSLNQLLTAGLTAAVGVLLVCGWWYLRSWQLYGTPLGLDAHYLAPWALTEESTPPNFFSEWLEVFYSFWAAFGWGNIKFPVQLYYPLMAIIIVGVTAVGLQIRKQWQARRQIPPWFWVSALAITAVTISLAIWMTQVTAPHGRLLFPALAGISLLLAVGWTRSGRQFLYVAISYLFFLNIIGLLLLIRPAYAEPAFLAPPPATATTLGWQYDDFAELVSVTALERSATAGQELPVEVCWQTTGQADEDYTVLVQLVGPENQIAGGRRTYPGLGSYPTSIWEVGRYFCDEIAVTVNDELPQTLRYQIEVVFVSQSGDRVAVSNPDGTPRDHLFASAVRLETAEPIHLAQPPAGSGPIRLNEAQFDPTWQFGTAQTVTLQWWLAEDLAQDYTTFVHVRDSQTGQNVAQGDGPPLDGWYPTSLWQVGEVVDDVHTIERTADLVPGTYDLVVGWYDPVSGERLGSEVNVGTIEVVP